MKTNEKKELWNKIYFWRKATVIMSAAFVFASIAGGITSCSSATKQEKPKAEYNAPVPEIETIIHTPEPSKEPIWINKTTEKNEIFTLTAYCPCRKCCGKWANGITSTGTKAQAGRTIAVDPRKIPYGTKVIIDGHTYIAEDCGGAIKGNRIDVYFDTHREALNFGRQTKEVTILN
jgi:3D (Asp-Asp-Asp) domain-containing protein